MPLKLEDSWGVRPFAELAEAFWSPDEPTVIMSQLTGDGQGSVTASLALGVFGSEDSIADRDAGARWVERDLASLRIEFERCGFSELHPALPLWALRLRAPEILSDGRRIPSRFTHYPNSFTQLSDVLTALDIAVAVRITHSSAVLSDGERAGLRHLSEVEDQRFCSPFTASPAATAADILGRLSGVVFEREVMVMGSNEPLSRVDIHRIASCLTSSFASSWTGQGATASNGPIARGGCEIRPVAPADAHRATRLGLPLTVLQAERRVGDLVPLEGLLWGVPCPRAAARGLTEV